MRITVGTILTLLRHQTPEEILRDYPYLEREDIDAALEYAAHLADEREVVVEDRRVRVRRLPLS
jgi:uncharacterized protein (DUF433 family)